ncbi:hypothetical protein, partial [Staphylococcus aureus]
LANKISNGNIAMMNYKVKIKNEKPFTVAKNYLKAKRVIK